MTSSNTLPHGINSVPIVSPRNTSIPHPLPHHIAGKNHGNLIHFLSYLHTLDTKPAITTPEALSSLSFYTNTNVLFLYLQLWLN